MMKLPGFKQLLLPMLLLALAGPTLSAAEEGVLDKAGRGLKKGGEAAGRGIEKGAEATGKGLKKGGEATVKGVKKAGDWVGKGLNKAGKKIEGASK